jgi:two-component system, sensor histidine kinase and response regulator
MVDDQERCLDAGMDDFLSKPVQLKTLREKVNHWLNSNPRSTTATSAGPDRTTQPQEELPVLDQQVIAELLELGEEFVASLVENLTATMPQRIAAVRTAVVQADAQELANAAHSLRGGAANLGGMRLAALCGQLEEAGRQGRLTEAVHLIPGLPGEAAHLLDALSAVVQVAT